MSVGSASNTYEILAKLAEGGMAEIFIARSATGAGVERLVVLKRILPQHADNAELVHMFLHEARLAAQLHHANVAQVYDVGRLGSSYFFTMEHVHGTTVRDLMLHARNKNLRIPHAAVLTVAAGAAAGLHHAHERRGIDGRPLGIVHSDISPSNLMVSDEGVVKVVDFGIARAAGSKQNTDGALRGKSSYLSPEQCHSSRTIDRRSDIYSLGIVLWEMLTLQGLYRRASEFENLLAIESEPVPPPSRIRSDIPPELDTLVMRCLEKRPEHRFQTAAALLEMAEQVAMQLKIMPSVSGLGRIVQDWFGVRAEPWLEETKGGRNKRLVVAGEPVPSGEHLVKTLSAPIDDELKTLQPTRPPHHDIPGDTIPDEPARRGKGESLEQIRDRLFREAAARKTPNPDEEDPFDGRPTIQMPPVAKVIRHEDRRVAPPVAQPMMHPPSSSPSGAGTSGHTVLVDRPSTWTYVAFAIGVLAVGSGLIFLALSC